MKPSPSTASADGAVTLTDTGPGIVPGNASLAADLESVHQALLSDARASADGIVADATDAAADFTKQATDRAQATVDDATERNRLAALAVADQMLAQTSTQARSLVLTAQRSAHEQLVDATRLAFQQLREHPDYPALLDRFDHLARQQLGADAVIERDPDPDGGIVGTAGTIRVDYLLPTLADRALDALGDEVQETWT